MGKALQIFVYLFLVLAISAAEVEECAHTKRAMTYMGTKSTSKSGFRCQAWASQEPNKHSKYAAGFPEKSLKKAKNYCRNPDNDKMPWCYIDDSRTNIRWEYCEIPRCEKKDVEECVKTLKGTEYMGTLNKDVNGKPCQFWSLQYPQRHGMRDHMFPEQSMVKAENYCRNPDNSRKPWCYTGVWYSGRWAYCNIPKCKSNEKYTGKSAAELCSESGAKPIALTRESSGSDNIDFVFSINVESYEMLKDPFTAVKRYLKSSRGGMPNLWKPKNHETWTKHHESGIVFEWNVLNMKNFGVGKFVFTEIEFISQYTTKAVLASSTDRKEWVEKHIVMDFQMTMEKFKLEGDDGRPMYGPYFRLILEDDNDFSKTTLTSFKNEAYWKKFMKTNTPAITDIALYGNQFKLNPVNATLTFNVTTLFF